MFGFGLDYSELEQRLRAAAVRGYDLSPLLKSVGKEWKEEAKEKIRSSQGMPALAPATLEKRQNTGTSLVTKFGKLRAGRAKRVDNEIARIKGLLAHYEKRWLGAGTLFVPPDVMQKNIALRKRLERLNKQVVRSQETEYADRKTGKSVADTWTSRGGGFRLGQRFVSSMYVKVEQQGRDFALLVGSQIKWSEAQNAGATVGNGATLPPSWFLVLTQEKINYLARRLALWVTEPLR